MDKSEEEKAESVRQRKEKIKAIAADGAYTFYNAFCTALAMIAAAALVTAIQKRNDPNDPK